MVHCQQLLCVGWNKDTGILFHQFVKKQDKKKECVVIRGITAKTIKMPHFFITIYLFHDQTLTNPFLPSP